MEIKVWGPERVGGGCSGIKEEETSHPGDGTAQAVTWHCCLAPRWLGSGLGDSRRRTSASVSSDHRDRCSCGPDPSSSRQPWCGAG